MIKFPQITRRETLALGTVAFALATAPRLASAWDRSRRSDIRSTRMTPIWTARLAPRRVRSETVRTSSVTFAQNPLGPAINPRLTGTCWNHSRNRSSGLSSGYYPLIRSRVPRAPGGHCLAAEPSPPILTLHAPPRGFLMSTSTSGAALKKAPRTICINPILTLSA